MKLAIIAMLPLVLAAPADVSAQRARTPPPAQASNATTIATITVTDQSGTPLTDVRVNLTGSVDRSGSTQTNGTVKFDGLRAGTYRLRVLKEGYVLLEREFDWRAGEPAPNPSIALSPAASPAATAPSTVAADKTLKLPPPGKPVTIAVPDFIERNFIANTQPQKVNDITCSGLAQTVLWQVRETWDNRQHAGADAMLYVVGGEGTLRLGGRDTPLEAGSFASVPRATVYALTRRGRNPLIILATLAGEPCP